MRTRPEVDHATRASAGQLGVRSFQASSRRSASSSAAKARDQLSHLRRGNADAKESLCGEVGWPGGVSCPISQVGRFQGRGEVVALGHVAAQRSKRGQRRFVLDALGYHT